MCRLGPQINAFWVLFHIEELFKCVTTPSFLSSKIQETNTIYSNDAYWHVRFNFYHEHSFLRLNDVKLQYDVCSRRVEILAIVAKRLPFCTHAHLITTSRVILFLKPRICRFFFNKAIDLPI